MICNNDRLLPVLSNGPATSVLASAPGSRDPAPAYLGQAAPFSGGNGGEAGESVSSWRSYRADELSAALKLSPHLLRYDPVWRHRPDARDPVRAQGAGAKSASAARASPKQDLRKAVFCGTPKVRVAANAGGKWHRVRRPTLAAPYHRQHTPHAIANTITANAWAVEWDKDGRTQGPGAQRRPAELTELQYLVAYNLVNNFYFNLVSWSPIKKSIAIAINSRAYWWNGSGVVEDIEAFGVRSVVSCISCSPRGHFAVATVDGHLSVYGVACKQARVQRAFAAPIFCIKWFPDGKHLLVGDSCGMIAIMRFCEGQALELVSQLYGLSQQICGFALNAACTEVAAGANENLAMVWDIANLRRPLVKCRLRHKSAVKGISFCPWAPALLATGGGSNDRCLRYWHTGSSKLLSEIDTKRQITSVFWSSRLRQVLVTFGHSTCSHHVVAAVYSYPGTQPVAEARSREPIRALSASVAPDETSVAVAANDGTVRVYSLWPQRPHALTHAAASGSYGSAIIETAERIEMKMVLR